MLRAVLIDDERPALDELTYLLEKNSVKVIASFQSAKGVSDFIAREKPDIVFLDIELREKNGIDVGVELQSSMGNMAIIFVTAYPAYALEAFRAYPLDYITKPVDEEHLVRTLRHIQETAIRMEGSMKGDFYIRCFGKLEITCGNQPIRLPTKKTRELFAYLLCNEGAMIYRDELIRLIFGGEDEGKNSNNLRVTLFRIRNALREAGIGKEHLQIREDLTLEIADGVCDIVDFQRFIRNNQGINPGNITKAEKIAGLINGVLFTELDSFWACEKWEWVMIRAEELFINMSVYYFSQGSSELAEDMLLRLLALDSLSEQGYHRLLDLYIRTKDVLKYRNCFERYREVQEKEYKQHPLKYYMDYYHNC